MLRKKKSKSVEINKVRVEASRAKRYEQAFRAYQRAQQRDDICFADWMRLALDARAAVDLGQ